LAFSRASLVHARHRLAVALAVLDFFQYHLAHLLVAVQVVVELALDEVAHKLGHRGPVGTYVTRAQLHLGLRLEYRLLHAYGDGGDHTVADVAVLEVAPEVLLERAAHRLLEGCQVCAPLGGMLTVDKRVVLLAILVGVSNRHLDVIALEMDYRIERVHGHVLLQQVYQTVPRHVAVTVEHDGQAGVEVGVILEHLFDELVAEGIVAENCRVGHKPHIRAVGLVTWLHRALLEQLAAAEPGTLALAVAHRTHLKLGAQRVHSLQAHTVQTDGFLESLAVKLAARVHLRHRVDQRAKRDTAAIVAHGGRGGVHIHDYLLAVAHHKLVYRVVEHLLDQHVYAVVRGRAVAQLAYVHAGAPADMLLRLQRADIVLGIVSRRCVHALLPGVKIQLVSHDRQRYTFFSKPQKHQIIHLHLNQKRYLCAS